MMDAWHKRPCGNCSRELLDSHSMHRVLMLDIAAVHQSTLRVWLSMSCVNSAHT